MAKQAPQQMEQIAGAIPALTVIVALVFAAMAYFLLFVPQLSRLVTGGSLDFSSELAREQKLQQYSKRIDAAIAEFDKLNPQLRQRVQDIVTDAPRATDMYVIMDALASKNGMVLTNIDTVPNDAVSLPDGRKILTVSIGVAGGSYPQLRGFLTDLENTVRVADIQGVSFGAAATQYSITMNTYYVGSAGAESVTTP